MLFRKGTRFGDIYEKVPMSRDVGAFWGILGDYSDVFAKYQDGYKVLQDPDLYRSMFELQRTSNYLGYFGGPEF